MIVYLATYPRCGNSFLRAMIVANWDYWVSPIYPVSREAIKERWSAINYAEAPTPVRGFSDRLIWGDWMAVYQRGETLRRMLRPGSKDWLTPAVRERLAAEEDIFFLKTHERPFDRYYPGERVIQMVRHPIAAIWSYKNLLDRTKHRDHNILDISEGKILFGSWSSYHDEWHAASQLPDVYFRVRYEDAHADEAPAIHGIAQTVGLPLVEVKYTDFENLRRNNPLRFRSGKVEGWRGPIADDVAARIWADHASAAARLEYRA